MSATADGETVHYFYDGVRRVQEVIEDATLTTQAEFVYGPDYVDEFVVQTRNDGQGGQQAFFVLQDANYNVVALLDTAGDVLEQYVWEPYGDLYRADESATPDIINRIGHQGLFLYLVTDGSTTIPIYYNRNRWYAPRMGRFLQFDPISSGSELLTVADWPASMVVSPIELDPISRFDETLNLYLALASNPASNRDVSGLFTLLGLGGGTALRLNLSGQQADAGASALSAIRGFVGLVNDRNQALSEFSNIAASPYDTNAIDFALAGYNRYQNVLLAATAGGACGHPIRKWDYPRYGVGEGASLR